MITKLSTCTCTRVKNVTCIMPNFSKMSVTPMPGANAVVFGSILSVSSFSRQANKSVSSPYRWKSFASEIKYEIELIKTLLDD